MHADATTTSSADVTGSVSPQQGQNERLKPLILLEGHAVESKHIKSNVKAEFLNGQCTKQMEDGENNTLPPEWDMTA